MLDVVRPTRSKQSPLSVVITRPRSNDYPEMPASKSVGLRSSLDDGPSKASSATNPGQPRAMSMSRPTPTPVPSHEASQATSRHFSTRVSAPAHAFPSRSSQTSSALPNSIPSHQPSSPFAQASSGVAKPSTSFIAAHGEFHAPGNPAANNEDSGCIGQMESGEDPRGSMEPHGLSLDSCTGYFPQGLELRPGNIGLNDLTQLSDHLSLDDLLRVIAAERIHHMPQKGSNWDRSIRTLESILPPLSKQFASRY